jgi:hypothetical protein
LLLLLSPLVVFPSFKRKLNVVLLALFRSTAENDDYLLALPALPADLCRKVLHKMGSTGAEPNR